MLAIRSRAAGHTYTHAHTLTNTHSHRRTLTYKRTLARSHPNHRPTQISGPPWPDHHRVHFCQKLARFDWTRLAIIFTTRFRSRAGEHSHNFRHKFETGKCRNSTCIETTNFSLIELNLRFMLFNLSFGAVNFNRGVGEFRRT